MGRYFGKIGYATTVEKMTDDIPPKRTGVFEDQIVEREYYGDVIKLSARWLTQQEVNDNVRIGYQISIVADAFADQNFSKIKWAEFMGVKWKVTDITPERPRILLTLGGEYHE